MRRSPESRFEGLEALASSLTHWSVKIAVPQGRAPLILSADVRESLYGRIRSLLFRLDPVWIEITRRSGRTERYRTVPGNLATGVMVNALPRNLTELNLFGRPDCMPADPILSLQFTTTGPKEFLGEIPLRWALLRTRALTEKSAPCVVAEAPRREFPSWGGAGRLTITAGDGQPWKVESTADWLPVAPSHNGATSIDFTVRANTGMESRRSTLSVGGFTISITQAGISQETVPRTIQLGLFRPNHAAGPEEPGVTTAYKTLVDCLTTFGLPGDQPVMGDWTGDGRVRIGVFRAGTWFLDLNGNGQWDGVEGGDGEYALGLPGDTAVAGDWTGDGVTKLGVFREGNWYLDLHNLRRYDPSVPMFSYGLPGDIPVVGKWKAGSAIDQIGVFRKGRWYVDSNGDRKFQLTDAYYDFGRDGDIPVVSRSRSRLGVYREGTWVLDIHGSRRFETTDAFIVYGSRGDRPLIGEW
jgi:hypothetical protein